jgi:hypothetical protein
MAAAVGFVESQSGAAVVQQLGQAASGWWVRGCTVIGLRLCVHLLLCANVYLEAGGTWVFVLSLSGGILPFAESFVFCGFLCGVSYRQHCNLCDGD